MTRFTRSIVLLAAAIAACPLNAAEEPPHRPRIGLVLAGGGAKGGAHIGALKVLEEMRVPVDCIAGTSMGALIGAGYASGQPAEELEKFITGIDWSTVVGGVGRRRLKPAEENRLATDSFTEVRLGLRNGAVVTPAGLVDTGSIDDLLRTYVAQARMVDVFDNLPIPFRAVATDMISGRMVVLDHGDLATAMRASMAIPGAFSPVPLGDMLLADGGMVRNIPIDVARTTCADVVIVVNLVESAVTADRLAQAQQLAARSNAVMIMANENLQLQTLGPRDVLIAVPMGDITTSDFSRVPETIPLGEKAAHLVASQLAPYALSEEDYRAWRSHVTSSQSVERRLAHVRFDGLKEVNPAYLESLSSVHAGDDVTVEAISASARRMAALDELESVAYRLEGPPEDTTLVWLPKESSIGQQTLSPSLGLYADGRGDLKFQLGIQHVSRWLNELGGQWRNNLQVGYETSFTTSFYQPVDVAQHVFIEPRLFAVRTAENVFVEDKHIADVEFMDTGGAIDIGWNAGRNSQLRVGYWNSRRDSRVQTGPPGLGHDRETDAGVVARLRYDSRNTAAFATGGMSAAIEYYRSDDGLGADRSWERLEAGARTSAALGRAVAWFSVAGGTDLGGSLPADRDFRLGGPRSLPGYQFDEIRAQRYWLVRTDVLTKLRDLVSLKNEALYGGLGIYAAGVYDQFDAAPDDEIYGVTAYVGGSTPFGTISLGAGFAPRNSTYWLSIGRPLGRGTILQDGLFR